MNQPGVLFALTCLLALGGCAGDTSAPVHTVPEAPATEATPARAGSLRTIDVPTLHAELGSVAILVDVRTGGEYRGGHVPGAVNIPLDQLAERMGELDAHRDKPVYVICQVGGRSRRAAGQLEAAGFDVVDVQGGTGGWVAAGYPTE